MLVSIYVPFLIFKWSSSFSTQHSTHSGQGQRSGNWAPLEGLSAAYLPGLWFDTLVKLCCGWRGEEGAHLSSLWCTAAEAGTEVVIVRGYNKHRAGHGA